MFKVATIRRLSMAIFSLATAGVSAEPMKFQPGGNDTRCRECGFIQASGNIADDTPQAFQRFLDAAPNYVPKRIRLNSPGGSLQGGIRLGELFRARGFTTEVGSDRVDPEGHPHFGGRASVRTPGVCASACAYAFLGGIERVLDDGSKLGVHRFYTKSALTQPTEKLFSGRDLDDTQKIAAALVLYLVNMGIDARVVALAATAGPDEIYWITPEEARDLRVTYEPRGWKPWQVEPFRGGAVAVSETNDGTKRMVASCTRRLGPQVVLTNADMSWDVANWFEQCRTGLLGSAHPVFGTEVDPSRVQVSKRKEGGAFIRFRLPTTTPNLASPALFSFQSPAYPYACGSDQYEGSKINFEPAVRLAFGNCFQD
ncbi:hypothetical protein [Bradyrhizobium sp. CCBAU 11357]|uniref:COG3904 family protein n=1 Tax=Bradyrhizobium sp. CCBAU 11357 TaxID=1630808 RepID=UPI0023038E9C|nr:hypothetical protein [Bradyrhizobium sp. CCBAU 11357]